MNGFIDTLFTQFGNRGNATLSLFPPFIVHHYTRTGFSFFAGGILTTALSLQTTHKVFFSQPNSLLAISSDYPWTAISRTYPILDNNSLKWNLLQLNTLNSWQQTQATFFFFITPRHGPHITQSLSIVEKACLLIRCLAIDVQLLRALAPAGMCLPSRCLPVGLYVIVCSLQLNKMLPLNINRWHQIINGTWKYT
jgi:hypothetical protein